MLCEDTCSYLLACRDDAVLYDRAAVLIPHYWARVPHDYKVVYIGHIQSDSTLPKEIVHGALHLFLAIGNFFI